MTQTTKADAATKSPSGHETAVPGGEADRPTEIPARGWLQVAKRGWAEAKTDQVPLLAAGVAYYAFMALFPALVACVLLYGLIADPASIARNVNAVAGAVPGQVRDLIVAQLQSVSSRGSGAGIGVVVSLLLALFSASGGVSNLMTAISTAYDEKEKRSFIKKRLLALALTVGAVVFMLVMLTLVAVLPHIFDVLLGGSILRWVLEILRWVLLVVFVAAGLAVLYRVAPDRDAPKMRWVSVGAIVATVLWVIASVGFSIYSSFGSYAKTYGAVAGIVVLLLWLFITAYAILLGAEINAEAEQQTVKDSTVGPEQPIGERGAVKADSMPADDAGAQRK
jgi:membrane protein